MKVFDAVTLTTAYADNRAMVTRGNPIRRNSYLFLEYTKGDETSMQISVEYSDLDTSNVWYSISKMNLVSNVIEVIEPSITATGKYAIDFDGNEREDVVRISVKATGGTLGNRGTVTMYA